MRSRACRCCSTGPGQPFDLADTPWRRAMTGGTLTDLHATTGHEQLSLTTGPIAPLPDELGGTAFTPTCQPTLTRAR